MNRLMSEQMPLFRLYQELRTQLMASLNDDQLRFSPGGGAPPLGALCLEIGEIEQAYIDSFRSFQQSFSYRHPDRQLAHSVAALQHWYEELDLRLEAVLAALSDEDLANVLIDRGAGFQVSVSTQLAIYQEALLIFYGKAWVYTQCLGLPLPNRWQAWIG